VPGVVEGGEEEDTGERCAEGIVKHDVGRGNHHKDTPDDAWSPRGRELEGDDRNRAEDSV
jgi:hypothetical protein